MPSKYANGHLRGTVRTCDTMAIAVASVLLMNHSALSQPLGESCLCEVGCLNIVAWNHMSTSGAHECVRARL